MLVARLTVECHKFLNDLFLQTYYPWAFAYYARTQFSVPCRQNINLCRYRLSQITLSSFYRKFYSEPLSYSIGKRTASSEAITTEQNTFNEKTKQNKTKKKNHKWNGLDGTTQSLDFPHFSLSSSHFCMNAAFYTTFTKLCHFFATLGVPFSLAFSFAQRPRHDGPQCR